jgi:tetratricopeptide (TPR) repeat protein
MASAGTDISNELFAQLASSFNRREWHKALALAARILPQAPSNPNVHFMAGMACLELHQTQPAVNHLRQATSLAPERVDIAVQFAKALFNAQMNRDAKIAADRALALTPHDAQMLDTLGVIYSQIGVYDSAIAAFRAALAIAPGHAPLHYNLSTALVASGDLEAAEIAIEKSISLDPGYARAHLALSQLGKQTPEKNHIARLDALLLRIDNSDVPALVSLNMALAKEHEDLGNYPKAFDHLVRGKSVGGAKTGYVIQRDEALFAAITDSFDDHCARCDGGDPSHEPIFIVGMPRSGTTLVERIVSSHPDVQSAGELLNFGMSVKHMSGSKTPHLVDVDTIVRSRELDWRRLGDIYLSSTRPGTGQKPRFIDKLPHNFLYAGFIAKALPNAKIICLRREPIDTCLSNFRQLFAPKSPFFDYSFNLMDTARYYVLFNRLMSHWQRIFPGRILEIQYETLVDDQEFQSRQLLEFCGLPWFDDCLHFEKNTSPVATASAVQVRAPIYRSALKRWKKYEPQLGELQTLLREAGIKLDE